MVCICRLVLRTCRSAGCTSVRCACEYKMRRACGVCMCSWCACRRGHTCALCPKHKCMHTHQTHTGAHYTRLHPTSTHVHMHTHHTHSRYIMHSTWTCTPDTSHTTRTRCPCTRVCYVCMHIMQQHHTHEHVHTYITHMHTTFIHTNPPCTCIHISSFHPPGGHTSAYIYIYIFLKGAESLRG